MEELLHEVHHVAVRMWTGTAELEGKELCSILNEAIREDVATEHTVVISRALNSYLCIKRRKGAGAVHRPIRWPEGNQTFRGGGLPPLHRHFFVVGKMYRAPMFLATSFERH